VQSQVTGKGVLVTAAHVLEEMVGDTATIVLRMKAGNQWVTLPARFAIRAMVKRYGKSFRTPM
jgi:hypothetical protein